MPDAALDRLARSAGLEPRTLERLQRSTVAVIGAGLLGGGVLQHLALLRVPLIVIDCDRVGPENLGNAAFPAASVGCSKAEVRASQARALSPECRIEVRHGRIEDLGLAALAGCDLLICGLDSRSARLRVDDIARSLGKRWVDAAVDGTGRLLLGTVTVYDPAADDSPCYRCRLDSEALQEIAREGRGPGCPSWLDTTLPTAEPTLQASAFGAVVSGLQTLFAIRLLAGQGDALVGRQLLVQADGDPRLRIVRLSRNPDCLGPHRSLDDLQPLAGSTVGALLDAAARDLGSPPAALRFHGRTLLWGLVCPSCGAQRETLRMTSALGPADIRCGCAAGAEMLPVELDGELDAGRATGIASMEWASLGLPEADVVTALGERTERHYVVNPAVATPLAGRA